MIWALIGWALFGGAGGYAINRWTAAVVVAVLIAGASLIIEPSAPSLKFDGDWANTVAFGVGYIVGSTLAERAPE